MNALGDDHTHFYSDWVSKPISASQLSQIKSYVLNRPTGYSLNDYNCADFAITIGNLGGMNLPDTYLTWGNCNNEITTPTGGSSPGALGNDIREMTLGADMSRGQN
jgi:hypothetical protein